MEEFKIFTELPWEIQREILIQCDYKQIQRLSKTIRELTFKDANRYRCLCKIKSSELERYLGSNPTNFGIYIHGRDKENIIFSANNIVLIENKQKWIRRLVQLKLNGNLSITKPRDLDVTVDNKIIIFNNSKIDLIESYEKGEIVDIDLKAKYEILLKRFCEKEEAKLTILNELEKQYAGVDSNDINYGSLNLYTYLMYNANIFQISLEEDKDASVEEILANNKIIYEQLKDKISELNL